jgi:hypothetical protein
MKYVKIKRVPTQESLINLFTKLLSQWKYYHYKE